MDAMWAASAPLAVTAAFLFAVSAALQQSAARSAALAEPRPQRWLQALYLLRGLLRNKRWMVGWATNIVGFGLHAAALHYGSITAVQPWLVFQLLFALPMAVARRRRRPLLRDWIGTLLVCIGLVTMVVQELPHGEVRREVLPHAAAIALVTIVLLVCAAQFTGPHVQ